MHVVVGQIQSLTMEGFQDVGFRQHFLDMSRGSRHSSVSNIHTRKKHPDMRHLIIVRVTAFVQRTSSQEFPSLCGPRNHGHCPCGALQILMQHKASCLQDCSTVFTGALIWLFSHGPYNVYVDCCCELVAFSRKCKHMIPVTIWFYVDEMGTLPHISLTRLYSLQQWGISSPRAKKEKFQKQHGSIPRPFWRRPSLYPLYSGGKANGFLCTGKV